MIRVPMRQWTGIVVVLAIGFGSAGSRPVAAQTPPVPVALSGTPAPAGGNYGTFSTSASTTFLPVRNEAGRAYFYSDLTGGSSTAGLFAGTPGAVQAVALQGSPAPAGGNYTNSFSDLLQNASGQVAFSCSLTSGSAAQGMFVGTPGSLQTVVLTGTPSPGGGGNYSGLSSPLLNGSGRVGFSAALTGGSSTAGLFAGVPGSVQPVALLSTPSPAGGNYSFFSRLVLNAGGQVAFFAQMTGGPSTAGVFAGTPGAVQAVALQGSPAPAGGNYAAGLGSPLLNDAGQVAFVANLTGGPATQGVFAGAPGALQAVALQGNPAPAGGNYDSFSFDPVLNGAGKVAFRATLTGGSSPAGLFVGTPGAVQAAALAGAAAPAGGSFSAFFPPQLNGPGQVAFLATLTGAGVDTTNDLGLYAGPAGALAKVVRKGDQLDVDPGPGVDLRTVAAIGFRGDFNTVSGGQDGRGVALTDGGLLVFSLAFTDGSSGVFVSQLTPVPEPAVAGLVAAAGLAAAVWRRLPARRQTPNGARAVTPAPRWRQP
jgi:hypothetical protein